MKPLDSYFYFELDPYEQALEDELERLDAEDLLVSTLTPARRKEIQQTATNTLKALREGKRWMVERHSKYANASEELMNWLSPAAQEKLRQELKKRASATQEKPSSFSTTTRGAKLALRHA